MHWSAVCLISCFLMSYGRSLPLRDTARTTEERRHHQHHQHNNVNDDDVETEISKLRSLDAIIGRLEEAAASGVSLDVPLPKDMLKELSAMETRPKSAAENFRAIALPYKFKRYDLNGDGVVTGVELADATGTMLEDSEKPFHTADTNDDGLLTEDELHNAPWMFARD